MGVPLASGNNQPVLQSKHASCSIVRQAVLQHRNLRLNARHRHRPRAVQAIRNSSRYTANASAADFVFVDMHCYHSAWMAWLHPLNAGGRASQPNPELFIRRSLHKLQGLQRCAGCGAGWGGARRSRE